MTQFTHILNQVLPIILLLFLGNQFRRRRFLSENTVDELKSLVVQFALPSVLLLSFMEIELKSSYFTLFFIILGLCVVLFPVGKVLGRLLGVQSQQFPFLMTGFEYGMLGISLFGSAYGLEKIGYIAIVDLGHEFFIWFVYVPLIIYKRDGATDMGGLAKTFFKSPMILAILIGLALNALGVNEAAHAAPVAGALLSCLKLLAGLTIPLILIIVGYGIKLEREGLRDVLSVIGARAAIFLPLAYAGALLFRHALGLSAPFEAALFVFLILPPPFVLPLFMSKELVQDRRFVNNVLTTHTLFTIVVFITYLMFVPTI